MSKDFKETKLLNFYNSGGIRFQNIVAVVLWVLKLISWLPEVENWSLSHMQLSVIQVRKTNKLLL